MEFSQEQMGDLKNLFEQIDTDKNGALDELDLRKLLGEFEIDESFAPAMMRILGGPQKDSGVKFDDIIEFFKILMSGNIKLFFKMLFKAIDEDKDGELGLEDLLSFGKLVGDALSDEDAKQIISQSDSNNDGKVGFDEFWRWYKQQHGVMHENDDENDVENVETNSNKFDVDVPGD